MRKILIRLYSKATSSIRNSTVSNKAIISYYVKFYDSCIDDYSYVSNNCNIFHTSIGKFTSIGLGCNIGGGEHPLTWISTSPMFQNSWFQNGFSKHPYEPYKNTVIGNDVFIAPQVIIKTGIKIGDGAVLGAGAVITKDVGPYEIWAGNPAKLIRLRFTQDVVDELINLQWWNWTDEKIKECSCYINNPKLFLEKVHPMEE